MKKIIYVLYRYYSDGTTKDIAYFKAITSFLLIVFINSATIATFIGYDLPNLEGKSKVIRELIFLLFFVIHGYLIVSRFVKERDLQDKSVVVQYKKRHSYVLIVHCLLSVLLFTIVLINKVNT